MFFGILNLILYNLTCMKKTSSVSSNTLKTTHWWTKIFGNKEYVHTLLKVFVPAVLQALISIVVLYVDNFSLAILISDKVQATSAKNALGLANPVINFGIFLTIGWVSGMTIMMSQYYGNKDSHMTQQTTAFRIWSVVLVIAPIVAVFLAIPGKLVEISSQVNSGDDYELARIYLWVSAWTFFPYVVSVALSFSLQETQKAGISFIAALVGMSTNIVLDPIFIVVSKDVQTAVALVAMSTGIARICQLLFAIIYIIVKKNTWCWFFNAWRIKRADMSKIVRKGLSVFINETIFGFCAMILMMCLLRFDPAIHTATTNLVVIIEITNVIWPGMGSAAAVLVGAQLGKNDIPQAKKNANILMSWGISFSTAMVLIVLALSFFINPILSPDADNQMNYTAQRLEWVMLPIIWSQGIFSVAYYSIRSGGTKMVLLIDCGIMTVWASIMAGLTFSNTLSGWDPVVFLFVLEGNQIVKMMVSLLVYKFYPWAKNLTHADTELLRDEPVETYMCENAII